MSTTESLTRYSTGIEGLDVVLNGGLPAGRAYLVRGGPGTGKTTLGFHFLRAGASAGQTSLYITLEESEVRLRQNAALSGLDLEGVHFLDLSPTSEFFAESKTYDIFSPAEVEREPTARRIRQVVQDLQPVRVFIDPMTQFRYLSSDIYQYRKQVLSFLRFLAEQGSTVLFTSESSDEVPDADLQFLSDGVLHLEYEGGERRLRVCKLRGSAFREGWHFMRVGHGGLRVFPRLDPGFHGAEFLPEPISSGVPEIDELLHGGVERGTITLVTGPSGVGKTTLGLQFMKEAAGRGERSVVFSFEEEPEVILCRCEGIGLPARSMIEHGKLRLVKVEPTQYSPDEFADQVRLEVEKEHTRVVMIDSTQGYELSVRGSSLVDHLHVLLKYLQHMGVAVFLVTEVRDVLGAFRISDAGISYLADNVIFLRFLEIEGQMRKAIGVLKKRLSDFEKTLREIQITHYGIKVGEPLSHLRGVLAGVPEWIHTRPSDPSGHDPQAHPGSGRRSA